MGRILLYLLVAGALFCTWACGDAGPAEEPGESRVEKPLNVVLVLADTLRADHMSLYGYSRPTTPNLERLAEESVVFEGARAQASCTFPSANSILTGRVPNRFLGQDEGRMGIPDSIPSIAERLGEAGWATLAVSSSPIVRATPSDVNLTGGFDRGFDVFEERCLWQNAGCVNYYGLSHLDAVPEPFFLYLHYLDPHDPFAPPQWWKRRFAGSGEGLPEWVRRGDPNPIADAINKRGEKPNPPPGALEHFVDLYDEEIAYFDHQLQRLLDHLEGQGLLDRTLLILVSDHGEEFLEHGQMKHCYTLYDTEIKTPLLVRPPGGTPGRRVSAVVSNLDVVPTILDAVGLGPIEGLDGRSLYPAVAEPVRANDLPGIAFASWGARRAVIQGDSKLLYDLKAKRWELFDLDDDPGETRNLMAGDEDTSRPLQRRLVQWMRETEQSEDLEHAAERDQEATERLRALGYIN